ncbi:3-hydroxyisobutyryl-CoA hydrolase, mitochondrial [Halyomorpha halys]|uniref:3-hydroxyisobutyryl-CoA hydrolase, mitochondrial n=1 Tax=Halyomorpha halys TaxID=286706 RepID=UPI0006D51F70|nr:3-hydroxyisobutyryl-CoA hydrolase, mitochondrial [Halyomorpha halys]
MIVLKSSQFKKFLTLLRPKQRMFSTSESEEVLFETKNKCGVITLNKPKALNAINLSMVQSIYEQLEEWENTMSMVIIRGVGRAFCAGGDIKGATSGGPENTIGGKMFFKTEYKMNHKIGTYKLPYIALLDGITMGGGVGLSVHGKYRVATENTMFAMPETAIGLFPDVGASHFLSRIPGNIGMFLALTGYRLKGAECLKIGFATNYCKSTDIPELFDCLVATEGKVEAIEETLSKFTPDTSSIPFSLQDHEEIIDKTFGLRNVEDIFSALEKSDSPWAKEISNTMSKMSPTSLKISQQELIMGKSMDLRQCLQMEYRLAVAALEGTISHDFYEGVRALLIDKDKSPKWKPETVEEITESMILECFAPILPEDELVI